MKTDKLTGPGNVTTALGLTNEDDGVNILSSHINLSPRIHIHLIEQSLNKEKMLKGMTSIFGDLI